MVIKGYTLIEMTLVLFVIVVLTSISPLLFRSNSILIFEVERIKDLLIDAQAKAIINREVIDISIENTSIQIREKRFFYSSGVTCQPYSLYFNQKGNVNMANTIHCSYLNNTKEIVITLGNGSIYVR